MTKEKIQAPIFNHIQISQNQRGISDIQSWRNAIKNAENVTFPRRTALLDLYDEILLDPHLSGVLEKRKLRISNTPLLFIEDGKENAEIAEIINTDAFVHLINFIIESKFYGYSLIEISMVNNALHYELLPRKHVVPELGIVLKRQFDSQGINYREAPYSNFLLEVGENKSLGLLVKAAGMVLYKKNCLGDWSQYIELFGQPTKIGKYNAHDEQTRNELNKILSEMGSAAWAVLPESASIEFIQNQSMASAGLYEAFVTLIDSQISRLILGNTMTTTSETGGLAQAKVHQEEQRQITFADQLYVKNILNDKLIPIFKDTFGINCGNGRFIFRDTEHIDKPTKLEMDLKIYKETGIEIDESYWREQYNIPAPTNKIKTE
jgi:hypothetical protein